MRGAAVNPVSKKASRWAGGGCFGIFAFVGGIIYLTMFTNTCARMMGKVTYPITGDTRHIDPFALLAQVRAKVGPNAHLTKIEIEYVRSDGTMDLQATYKPAPNVNYYFQIPIDKAPKDAPPVGAGGRGPNSVWVEKLEVDCYEPGAHRQVTEIGPNTKTRYTFINEGMDFHKRDPEMMNLLPDIGDPKISVADIWKLALAKGAPKDAVALIDYSASGYTFDIVGSSIHLSLKPDGKNQDGDNTAF